MNCGVWWGVHNSTHNTLLEALPFPLYLSLSSPGFPIALSCLTAVFTNYIVFIIDFSKRINLVLATPA